MATKQNLAQGFIEADRKQDYYDGKTIVYSTLYHALETYGRAARTLEAAEQALREAYAELNQAKAQLASEESSLIQGIVAFYGEENTPEAITTGDGVLIIEFQEYEPARIRRIEARSYTDTYYFVEPDADVEPMCEEAA